MHSKKIIISKISIALLAIAIYILGLLNIIESPYIMPYFLAGVFLIIPLYSKIRNIPGASITGIICIALIVFNKQIIELFHSNLAIIPIVGLAIGILTGLLSNRMIKLKKAKQTQQATIF